MIAWYVQQIKMGRMTLDDVPKRWHNKVKIALEKDGEEN